MAKKKSLVRVFTRQVKSAEDMAPSQFVVRPKFKLDSYEDSNIDEIKKYKELDEGPIKKNIKPKTKKIIPKKVENLDREKIKRIAKKLNMLKKLDLENKKKQAQLGGAKDWGAAPGRVSQEPKENLNNNVKKNNLGFGQEQKLEQNKEEFSAPKKEQKQKQKSKQEIIGEGPEKVKDPFVKKNSKFSLRGLFSKSKKPVEVNPKEIKKKKRVLNSEEVDDIPDLPED